MVALMRRFRWAALPGGLLAVLVGSLLFAAGSGASGPQSRTVARSDAVFATRGQITKLAASGNLVAALMTHIQGSNDQIVVWWAPGSKAPRFETHVNSANPDTAFQAVSELALGSGRVAWLEVAGGNSEEEVIYSAPVGGGTAKQLVYAANKSGAAGGIDGDYVGQLLGLGHLLFYNQWHVCDYEDSGSGQPTPACPVRGKISGEQLLSIVAGRRVPVASGPAAFQLVAVGGGRLALQSSTQLGTTSGAITVATPAGTTVATVAAATDDPPRVVAVSATHLLLERAHTIDSYNPATGARIGTIPFGPGLELAGVNTRLALVRGLRRLVLIRLSDGKRVTFPLPGAALSCACPVDAKLNETGLFYAYNVPAASAKGRVVFEPIARLLARF
jgi:hypothetical protein